MNGMTLFASSITMTSREIAELTDKRHADVMRDIRNMIGDLDAAKSANADLRWHCQPESYTDAQGKERDQYRLDKNTTITLLTGYRADLRMKVIVRWQELEAGIAQPALNPANFSRLQLIELAMQAEQERLVLETKVAEIRPRPTRWIGSRPAPMAR